MKYLIIFITILSATTVFAQSNTFIQTEERVIPFERIKQKRKTLVIGFFADGSKCKFAKEDVIAYKSNGFLFEKVPVIIENKMTSELDLMKVICKRSDMTLYEYKHKEGYKYYVYRKDRFILELSCNYNDLLAGFYEI